MEMLLDDSLLKFNANNLLFYSKLLLSLFVLFVFRLLPRFQVPKQRPQETPISRVWQFVLRRVQTSADCTQERKRDSGKINCFLFLIQAESLFKAITNEILYTNQEICNQTNLWKFQLISLFLLRENSKKCIQHFCIHSNGQSFCLTRRKLIIGSYFTNYSKTITLHAEIFQGKFLPSLSLYHVSYM